MALAVAIDTNRYVDLCREDATAVTLIEKCVRIVVPFIVLAELRCGFNLGGRVRQNEQALSRFLQLPRVEAVFPDDETTRNYALISTELRRGGTPIPTNDIWIAAIVLQHDLVLFSRDRHFDAVPHIARV